MAISQPKRIIRPAASGAKNAAESVKHHLAQIAMHFDQPKLTLIIRSPTFDGDVIVGNDELDMAIKAIQKAAEENSHQLVIKTH
jgi:hypothetical protein